MDYISSEELRAYMKDTSQYNAETFESAPTLASRAVDALCERTFSKDTSASARVYEPDDYYTVCVDDFWTTAGLILKVDDGYNGTYGTTWTLTTDYLVYPPNGRTGGLTVPYDELVATGVARYFPPPWLGRTHTVQVTAQWGWASVPDLVVGATKLLAAEHVKMSDVPLGIVGIEFGGLRVGTGVIARARALLGPYMRAPLAIV
jgi:hypothetical protein